MLSCGQLNWKFPFLKTGIFQIRPCFPLVHPNHLMYDQNFNGGGRGGGWVGGNRKRCVKWGSGGWESLRNHIRNVS